MVLPSKPPMTAPPTVLAIQLNSELRELPPDPDGVWQPTRAPSVTNEIAISVLFMACCPEIKVNKLCQKFYARIMEQAAGRCKRFLLVALTRKPLNKCLRLLHLPIQAF
jgi:hypothetical protein